MIHPVDFTKFLSSLGIEKCFGVPDSLTKDLLYCMKVRFKNDFVITANEGSSIASAIGYYLATKKLPLVFMQNSGIGNAVNPLISLAHKKIYAIPMIIIIGWRGEVNEDKTQLQDEPQHLVKGEKTLAFLDLLDIPYLVIDSSFNDNKKINQLKNKSIKDSIPVAIVIKKNTFIKINSDILIENDNRLSRESVIQYFIEKLYKLNYVFFGATGMISRELYENVKTSNIFLAVGGMGHVSQIAAEYANNNPRKKVICFDGDGSMLMHCGALIESAKVKNFIHIVLNNESHDSVGGQPSIAQGLPLAPIAKKLGYFAVKKCKNISDIAKLINEIELIHNSLFIEIIVKKGYRNNLGRPSESFVSLKNNLMNYE